MKRREKEFTELTNLILFTGTWNVNGRLPPNTTDLKLWLSPSNNNTNNIDLYFVGLQEIDMSAEAFLRTESETAEIWLTAVEGAIQGHSCQYKRLVWKQLVGMLLIVYCRSELYASIKDVSIDSKGCGTIYNPTLTLTKNHNNCRYNGNDGKQGRGGCEDARL